MNFEILNRKTVLEGRIFDVQNVDTRLPDGRELQYNLVVHAAAVALVPLDSQGKICFVRQFRIGAGEALLELPAGVLDPGEAPETAAAREIREETGLAAGRLLKLGEFFMSPGYCTEYMYVYLAQDLTEDPLSSDEDEFIRVEKIALDEVYAMVRRNELRDGKTLAALLLALPALKSYGNINMTGHR